MTSIPGSTVVAPARASISTGWLAGMLVTACTIELVILRVGTRTAIHIPDIEFVAAPLGVVAAAGRLAFYTAVVLLGTVLLSVARDLRRLGQRHQASCVLAFLALATLAALQLVDTEIMAPPTLAVVVGLGVVTIRHQAMPMKVALGLLVAAVIMATVPMLMQIGSTGRSSGGSLSPLGLAELLAMAAALLSGPMVTRTVGANLVPPTSVLVLSGAVGSAVTGAMLANPSTVRILMLWNFGLTGGLPAPIYGLAAASLVLAVTAALRFDRPFGYSVVLLVLGGVGLANTYQTGLFVAGLALLHTAETTGERPFRRIGGTRRSVVSA